MARPKLIIFDLDYTLWPFWVDTNHTPPFTRGPSGTVRDQAGFAIQCYPDVPAMLQWLQHEGYTLAVASRTTSIQDAKVLVKLFGWLQYISMQEIYPGSKVKHFNSFHNQSGIAYKDMLFFDDEQRNIRDISQLGVTCILADAGMSFTLLQDGLKAFSQKRGSTPNV